MAHGTPRRVDRPRRARREMAPRGEVEKCRGGTGGTARGRPVDGTPSPTFAGSERRRHGEKQRGERRDGGEGKTVIRSKFKIHFVNSNFSPSRWPQRKNF